MADDGSSHSTLDGALGETAGIHAARAQIAAARLRREVLIASGQLPGSSADSSAPLPTKDFPGYTLLREIHRGGQGVVYQALQQSTNRKVAIKVLLEGAYASKSARQRFEREIELVASLRHPNVISVFHSDQTADGLRFCVMDYVRGLPLTHYVRKNQLTLEETLKLFARVCEAVNHAHQKGVIHRDLKPSNILVDVDGMPQVLDFGLAKLIGGAEQSLVSITGQVVGTLPYMSPEQTRGNPDEIDTRTDVYSLGVLLYETLTGRHPYPVVGPMADVLRHIAQTEPTPLRSAGFIPALSSWRGRYFGRWSAGVNPAARRIDDEVQTIVLKALAKERERRYQSAGELARDIGHYLAREPIEAKRASVTYLLRRQLARHKLAAMGAAAFLLVLIGGLAVSLTYWRSAEAAWHAEQQQRRRSEATHRFVTSALQSANPTKGGKQDKLVADAMMEAVQEIDAGAFKDDPRTEASLLRTISSILDSNGRSEEALRLAERACEINARLQPADNSEMPLDLNVAGMCLFNLGRYKEALPKWETALDLQRRLVPGDDPLTATILHNLGGGMRESGRAAEGLTMYEAGLEMRRRLYPGDHSEVAHSLCSSAGGLREAGKLDEALARDTLALEMFQRLHPGDHPDMAMGLLELATTLWALGRYEEALPKHEAAADMVRRIFHGDHPEVAMSLNNLSGTLFRLGRWQESLSKAEEALEMYQRLNPGDNLMVARSLGNVAACLSALDRHAEALLQMRAAVEMQQRLWPEGHPNVAMTVANIGACLDSLGRHAEALSEHQAALELRQRLFTGDHPTVAHSLQNVGACLLLLKRPTEALPQLEAALEMRRRTLPPDHRHIRTSEASLGSALVDLGRLDEAEPLLLSSHEALLGTPGTQGSVKQAVLQALVNLYEARHAAEPDQGHDAKAAEWRAKLAQSQASSQPAAP